jgi:hypothetical protein
MPTTVELRTDFATTITHIRNVFAKIRAMSGLHQSLTFPDLHKLSEGLFLSAWSHWEELCRDLMIVDLATTTGSALRRDVRHFRTRGAPVRLAERMLNHPDHPDRFVDWNEYATVVQRANAFLATGHRFVNPLPAPLGTDLGYLKRIRNSIAHRSDRAWTSFVTMVGAGPFNLTSSQRRGITPGRFVSAHQWGGDFVLDHTLNTLDSIALTLVP